MLPTIYATFPIAVSSLRHDCDLCMVATHLDEDQSIKYSPEQRNSTILLMSISLRPIYDNFSPAI